MGYDAMKAWTKRTFEFNDEIQKRGGSWSGKFSFDSIEGLSIVHPNYEPPPSPDASVEGTPTLDAVRPCWSPAASLRGSPEPMAPDSAIDLLAERKSVMAPTQYRRRPRNPRQHHVPDNLSSHRRSRSPSFDSVRAPDTPPLPPRDKHSLGEKLYVAACAGDVPHMQLLLSIGAPIDLPIMISGLYESFKPPKSGCLSALSGAAGNRQLAAVKFLLLNGAQLNPDFKLSSSSPLHQACHADDLEMARFLLDAGADVDALNCYRTTPLMYAVKHGSSDLVALLLAHAPDLHVPSFINTAAVHWAVWPGDEDTMDLILHAGADPNHRMGDGSTPLHCAAIADLPHIVECLLIHGADPCLRDGNGKTPAQVAESCHSFAAAELLSRAELEARRNNRR